MYLLSIDGGGTKTAFALGDMNGKQLDQTVKEGLDLEEIGEQVFLDRLTQGLQELCSKNAIRTSDIWGVCMGVPCYGESTVADDAVRRLSQQAFPNVHRIIVNDVVLAMYGALDCRKGIHVVSGTGSMAVGIDANGTTVRCGGWSTLYSDEGSGYWLGRKAMQLFSKQSDRRCERDIFYRLVKEQLELKEDLDLVQVVKENTNRAGVAFFHKLLYNAAENGSEAAQQLCFQAGQELCNLAIGAYRQLAADEVLDVTCSGGVLLNNRFVSSSFAELCRKSGFLNPKKAEFSPTQGGFIRLIQERNR